MTFPPRWDSRSAPRTRRPRRPVLLPLLALLLLVAATGYGLHQAAHPSDTNLIYDTPTEAP